MATAGKSVDYDGEIFELDGMSLELPTPIEMPIDVAALGERRGTRRAVRRRVGPAAVYAGGLERRMEDLRRGAEMANRDPESLRTSILLRACALEDGDRAGPSVDNTSRS